MRILGFLLFLWDNEVSINKLGIFNYPIKNALFHAWLTLVFIEAKPHIYLQLKSSSSYSNKHYKWVDDRLITTEGYPRSIV